LRELNPFTQILPKSELQGRDMRRVQQKNINEQINNLLATFCQKFTQGFLATHLVERD
jgi:hypothetical protein